VGVDVLEVESARDGVVCREHRREDRRAVAPPPAEVGLLYKNVQRFRGGLVFKAHRLVYHSTLGSRVIIKKKKAPPPEEQPPIPSHPSLGVHLVKGLGFRV